VAGTLGHQPSDPGDVRVQSPPRTYGWFVSPYPVDQRLDRYQPAHIDAQRGENYRALRRPHISRAVRRDHLYRTKQPYLHRDPRPTTSTTFRQHSTPPSHVIVTTTVNAIDHNHPEET
jgi:hypothetical protein